MELSALDKYRDQEILSKDGMFMIRVYSEDDCSSMERDIKDLFPHVRNFEIIGTLASGDMILKRGEQIVVVLHDSGEELVSPLGFRQLIDLIEDRADDFESLVYGE